MSEKLWRKIGERAPCLTVSCIMLLTRSSCVVLNVCVCRCALSGLLLYTVVVVLCCTQSLLGLEVYFAKEHVRSWHLISLARDQDDVAEWELGPASAKRRVTGLSADTLSTYLPP